MNLAAKLQVLRDYVETHRVNEVSISVSNLHDMVARIDELREESVSLNDFEKLEQHRDDLHSALERIVQLPRRQRTGKKCYQIAKDTLASGAES